MKKTFKGFTLVECIIAMAILAIASPLMASIYANVSTRNNANNFMNTSLANQMTYIEEYMDAETVPIYYGATTNTSDSEAANGSTTKYPPHKKTVSTNYNYVKVTKLKSDGTADVNNSYSFPVDIYVMYSRDNSDRNSTDSSYGKIAGSMSLDSTGKEKTVTKKADGTLEGSSNLRYKYILGHT